LSLQSPRTDRLPENLLEKFYIDPFLGRCQKSTDSEKLTVHHVDRIETTRRFTYFHIYLH